MTERFNMRVWTGYIAALAVMLGVSVAPAPAQITPGSTSFTANGGTTSLSQTYREGTRLSIADFGAIADGNGGADNVTSTSGSPNVTFATSSFTTADVGKPIFIAGIAAAGANFVGTIAGYTSLHAIVLSANAGASVTGATKEIAWGTDNTAFINAALDFARTQAVSSGVNTLSSGVEVVFPNGRYFTSSPLNFTMLGMRQGSKPVTITGSGATIIGTAVSGAVIDMFGTAATAVRDLSVYAGLYAGNASIGLQFGRVGLSTTNNAGAQTVYNVLDNVHVFGWFSLTALYDLAAEDAHLSDIQAYNARTAAGSYGAIFDGINHFGVTSTFQTQANAADTAMSFDDTVCDNCHLQNVGPSATVWMANTRHIEFSSGYIQNQGTNGLGVALYAGVGSISDANFNIHMEMSASLQYNFLVTGTSATPTFIGFSYLDASNQANTSLFALDTGVTSVTFEEFKVHVASVVNSPTVFDTASNYSLRKSDIFLPNNSMWPLNSAIFSGQFCSGASTTCAYVLTNNASTPSGMRGTLFYDTSSSGHCVSAVMESGTRCLAQSINVQTFAASGTYTPTTGMKSATVYNIGGGGAGGGGALQLTLTAVSGGGGGGGGSWCKDVFSSTMVGASQTITIAANGSAGAAASSNLTAGGNGGAGGSASFGSLMVAYGGGGGAGGQLAAASGGGGGGGCLSVGGSSTNSTAGTAGVGGGAAGGAGANGSAANSYGGSGAGGSSAAGAAFNGGNAVQGGSGGGSGGGITSGNAVANGGNGGNAGLASTSVSGGAGAGSNGTSPSISVRGYEHFVGSGAAGGASSTTSAFAGGVGGLPGGGGGGGGSAQNGGTAGAGGLGGAGYVIVVEGF